LAAALRNYFGAFTVVLLDALAFQIHAGEPELGTHISLFN
jgi:hypothetical protein